MSPADEARSAAALAGRAKARYSNFVMQKCYAGFLALAQDIDGPLYTRDNRDGTLMRRYGASHRTAFWRGFDGLRVRGRLPYDAMSQAHAIYMAGKEFAKNAPAWAKGAK